MVTLMHARTHTNTHTHTHTHTRTHTHAHTHTCTHTHAHIHAHTHTHTHAHTHTGVCDSAPEELNFDEFSEASDRERGTWILSGMDLIHEGSPLHDNYSLDLDELSVGSKVGVMVMRNGNLHFSLNGSDMGCAAKDVPSGKPVKENLLCSPFEVHPVYMLVRTYEFKAVCYGS